MHYPACFRYFNLKTLIPEALEVTKLAFPAILAQLCRIAVYIINGLFLGQLEDEAMAAAAIASSWHSVSLYVGIGLSFAMDSLVAQAYGARNFKLIGIVFQNSLIICLIVSIPIAICFWFTEPMLLLLWQDPKLSYLAGLYNKIYIIGLVPLLIYRSQCQYLQNIQALKPAMVSGFLSVMLSIPLNYVLIFGFPQMQMFGFHGAALPHTSLKTIGSWKGLGFVGAPLAGALTWLSQPILLWIYVWYTGENKESCEKCEWKEAVNPRRIWEYLKLGIPAALMLDLEVIGFELATILVGTFKETQMTKAHSIGFNLMTLAFSFPLGFSIGSSTRVGYMLGKGDAGGAKYSSFVGFLVVGVILTVTSSSMILLKGVIPKIYTSTPEVIALTSTIMPAIAVMTFLDGSAVYEGSLMRSIGKPLVGTVLNFIGYYITAIPISAALVFGAHLKLVGVWIGLSAGLAATVIGYAILIYRVDWESESKNAQSRVGAVPLEMTILDDGDENREMEASLELESSNGGNGGSDDNGVL